METILVDTSVWINFFRNFDTAACEYLSDNLTNIIIATCPVIVQEVLQGVVSDEDKRLINIYFDNLTRLIEEPYAMGLAAAEIYRSLRKKGITIRKPNDCLIAAYAIKSNLTLLEDDRDFKNIAEYSNLKIMQFE